VDNKNLCVDPDTSLTRAASVSNNEGDIQFVACQDAEYISNNNVWVPCLNNFFIRTVGGHEYMCLAEGDEQEELPDTTIRITISSNTFNYNLLEDLNNPTELVDVEIFISPGVIIGSVDVNEPSFTTGNLPQGSIVIIINKGKILGKGGEGGFANTCFKGQSTSGKPGGPALEITLPITLDNSEGIISGGGGGGGGGGDSCKDSNCGGGGGGGGGAGSEPGIGGDFQPSTCIQAGNNEPSGPGADGTETTGGAPGGGLGGRGGDPGEKGRDGRSWPFHRSSTGQPGGAAGENIITNGFEVTDISGGYINVEFVLGNGPESIIECCGSEACNSDSTDGIRLTTGQSIILDRSVQRVSGLCASDEIEVGVDDQGNVVCEYNDLISGKTVADCITAGGQVRNVVEGKICVFLANACPTGFTQFENYRTTVDNTNCPTLDLYQGDSVIGCGVTSTVCRGTEGAASAPGSYRQFDCFAQGVCVPGAFGVPLGQSFSNHVPNEISFNLGHQNCGCACAGTCIQNTLKCIATTVQIGCN